MRSTAGFPFAFQDGMEVALVPPVLDAPRRVTVEFAQAEGLDGGTVYFEEVEDANQAKVLVGCHCLIRRQLLPKGSSAVSAHRASWEGWQAYGVKEGFLGTVTGLVEMPAQIMIEIERDQAEPLLVPLVDAFLFEVDEGAKKVVLDLPSGLVDL